MLADRSGVSGGTLSRIESGKTVQPDTPTLDKIAHAFDMTLDDLLGPRPVTPRAVVDGRAAGVPLVRYAVQAGVDHFVRETPDDYTWIDRSDLRSMEMLSAHVVGDCMVPDAYHGDTVVWDRRLRDPQDGEMVVVTVPELGLLVKWVERSNGEILLVSNDGQRIKPEDGTLEGVVCKVIHSNPRRPRRAI